MKRSFSTKQRLRTGADFRRIYSARHRLYGRYYVLNYLDNEVGYPRVGIVASKRNARSAVTRNRLRRIAREAFRHYHDKLGAVDLVFTVRQQSAQGSRQELRQCVDRLLEQLIESS